MQRLVDVELDVRRVQEHIREQKSRIASLIARGGNVNEAQRRLQAFELAQDEHLAEIERLDNALAGTRAK